MVEDPVSLPRRSSGSAGTGSAAGPDLRQLFSGRGVLGIITEIVQFTVNRERSAMRRDVSDV